MEISYDPRKSERNLRDRGFDFEIVVEFEFDSALYAADTRKDYGQVRMQAIGQIRGKVYSLVFTIRLSELRVISLRKANRKERTRYENFKPRTD